DSRFLWTIRRKGQHENPLAIASKGAGNLALGLASSNGLTLVAQRFPASQSYRDLGQSAGIKEDAQRNERQSFLLDLGLELAQFGSVHKQFSLAGGVMILGIGEGVGVDVRADQPEFAAVNPDVGFLNGDVLVAKALDLRTFQNDAALEFFERFITKTS